MQEKGAACGSQGAMLSYSPWLDLPRSLLKWWRICPCCPTRTSRNSRPKLFSEGGHTQLQSDTGKAVSESRPGCGCYLSVRKPPLYPQIAYSIIQDLCPLINSSLIDACMQCLESLGLILSFRGTINIEKRKFRIFFIFLTIYYTCKDQSS